MGLGLGLVSGLGPIRDGTQWPPTKSGSVHSRNATRGRVAWLGVEHRVRVRVRVEHRVTIRLRSVVKVRARLGPGPGLGLHAVHPGFELGGHQRDGVCVRSLQLRNELLRLG